MLNVDIVQSQTKGMNAALARFAEIDDDSEDSSFRKLIFREFTEWFLRAACAWLCTEHGGCVVARHRGCARGALWSRRCSSLTPHLRVLHATLHVHS